jgi:hypothetical protein
MRCELNLAEKTFLYPMLTVLVGANVDDEPNYITVVHVGILDFFSIKGRYGGV